MGQHPSEAYNQETGLFYLRARYYDPATGRFLSEDPSESGLNWYTYCSNNPIVFIDPSGLVEVDMWNYADTYEGCTITYHDEPTSDKSYYTLSWEGKSFNVTLSALFSGTAFCVDDSLFVNAFGVGTNGILVYEDAMTGNVSIRAAFNFTGDTSVIIDGTSCTSLFLLGIEEGWSNSTTSVYARESSKGVTVNIKDKEGTSKVQYGLFGWSPSKPGKVTMYTNGYTADDFKVVAAHEFGHVLGINDGYKNATYKYYNSIMCDQWGYRNGTRGTASSLDIEKAVKAFINKKFQKWR